jgi:hypothetical protein
MEETTLGDFMKTEIRVGPILIDTFNRGHPRMR